MEISTTEGEMLLAPNDLGSNAEARRFKPRRDFSREFVISVPSVLSGEKPDVPLQPGRRSFIIPINWRSHSAKLVVSLS